MDFQKFKRQLISDNDSDLESLAQAALSETRKRFGRTVELYAPLYVSNYCSSSCTYCNFSQRNKKVVRKNLSLENAKREMEVLKGHGIDDILLLTGEIDQPWRKDFLLEYIELASKNFTKVGLEIFPASVLEYRDFHTAGVSYVTIYQETYNREVYQRVHKA